MGENYQPQLVSLPDFWIILVVFIYKLLSCYIHEFFFGGNFYGAWSGFCPCRPNEAVLKPTRWERSFVPSIAKPVETRKTKVN